MDVPSFENYEPPVYTICAEKSGMNAGVTHDSSIIGKTPRILSLFRQTNALADMPTTVLIRGETGTGKELFARALHYNTTTHSRKGRFVTVNCAGIPQELLESLLFGHVRGAFTSAYADKRGLVEEAQGGTLFLDEIGEMTPYLQAKLLRLLQGREITRVGDTVTKHVNVRIIAATNHNLEEKIKEGRFHSDLFYRINVFPLQLPPLRERDEDIPYLVQHFIAKYNALYDRHGICVEGASDAALQELETHQWPGNVRELENVITRAMILRGRGMLEKEDMVMQDSELVSRMIHAIAHERAFTPSFYAQNETPRALPRWFEKGVVPVLYSDLKRREGIHPPQVIRDAINKRQMYTINLRDRHRAVWAFLLSQETLPRLFTPESEIYTSLQQRISSAEFSKIAQEPFMVTSFFLLAQLGVEHVGHDLRNSVKSIRPYSLSSKYNSYFVLTEKNASDFVFSLSTVRNAKDSTLAKIQQEIHLRYEHFLNWQPGEPSWEVL